MQGRHARKHRHTKHKATIPPIIHGRKAIIGMQIALNIAPKTPRTAPATSPLQATGPNNKDTIRINHMIIVVVDSR